MSFIDEKNEEYKLSVKDYSFKNYLNDLELLGHINDLIKSKFENKEFREVPPPANCR